VLFDGTWGQDEQLGDFSRGPTLGDGRGDVGLLPILDPATIGVGVEALLSWTD